MRSVIVLALGLVMSSQAAPARASASLAERAQAAVTALDASQDYRSTDASTLAWGEAYVLTAFYWMYEATGDPAWLERIARRADVIFANRSQGDELYPGWRTTRYSVALVEACPAPRNASTAALKPTPARIYDIETAHKVTGHNYQLRITAPGAIAITDSTTGQRLADLALPADGRITAIPGVTLTLEGSPQPGDRFIVRTRAPKAFEYVVHDGMLLTPIAQFCAAVLADAVLTQRYGETARRYLEIIEQQLLPRWEPYWRDLPDSRQASPNHRAGVYIAQDHPAHREPGSSLPHNQYLALGRTFIALYRITGNPAYRERAAQMARWFKRNLRLRAGCYEWNYWDYTGPRDDAVRRMAVIEDTSHGHIDIGFAVEAYDAGIVFDRRDMERFARTVSQVMWNRSEQSPRLGSRVNTSQGDATTALDWVMLGRFCEQTRRIMVGMLESLPELGAANAAAAAQALALERSGWNPRSRRAAGATGRGKR